MLDTDSFRALQRKEWKDGSPAFRMYNTVLFVLLAVYRIIMYARERGFNFACKGL